MHAIILAAGSGTRLGSAAGGLPKCLLPVGGRPLVLHQREALDRAGLRPLIVVVGYEAERVREALGNRAETVLNPRYASTNSLMSLLAARDRLSGGFVLLHGDTLFDPAVLDALLKAGEDALAFDSSSGCDPEAMKVEVRDGRLAGISKALPRERASGESLGMLRLGSAAAGAFLRKAGELAEAGRTDAYWAEALAGLPVRAVDVAGTPWIEIDTPGDLERARAEVWPRIEERGKAPRKRVLFCGTAPVHFVCCQPIYRRLASDPRIDFWLSGGFKGGEDGESSIVLDGFYDPFPVDRERVIPLDRARREDFDVFIAAAAAKAVFPRSAAKKVQIFHGTSFRNFSAREKYLRFDYICLAGRYLADLYVQQGLVRPGGPQCLITGFAKDDPLVDGSLDREATLRRIGLDPRRPTILFAPTGSRHNAMETMGLDVVRRIRDDGRWNLIVKLHDHPKDRSVDWNRELAVFEGDRVRHVRELDVVPFIHAADLVMTDASSVATEFTLLDRPIVFLDVPELLKEVTGRGGVLDLETYGRRIGTLAHTPAEAVPAVADALANPQREGELRRAVARKVFHDPGRAADRVAGVVLHAAGLADELPAGVERVGGEFGQLR
jgi:choline kinase